MIDDRYELFSNLPTKGDIDMDTKISEILRTKGDFVLNTGPETSAIEAVRTMEDHNVGSILIQEDEEILGIFSERDYIRRVVLDPSNDPDAPVRNVMTSRVAVVQPEDEVEDCMAIMTEQRIRHLPVVNNGELKGLVSIGDCVKQVSKKAQARVKYLEDYITGKYPR